MAVTTRVLLPRVRETLAFASAVPEMAAVCSLWLIVSSPATVWITGRFGATVSTEILRVPAAETLPAASVACADRVSSPWPTRAMSSGVRV